MNLATYGVSETWDLDLLVELFQKIRGTPASVERFRWLYCDNPAGRARVWVLHSPSGAPIGFTSGYPRGAWVDGEPFVALNCGDFSVDVGHRTLGPASMLRRPAKQLVDSGEFAFLYAHPVPAMLSVHRRVGHPLLSKMTRWVYPLSLNELLRRRKGQLWSSVLAPIGNVALGARRRLQGIRPSGLRITEADEFGREYNELDYSLGQHYRVIGRRTQAYLDWRFKKHPELSVTIIEARESRAKLVGYLVLELASPTARVRDLAYLPDLGAERALLVQAARRAAQHGAESLNVEVQEGFPGTPALRKLGFWEREEEQPTVCYGGERFAGKALVEDAAAWFMTLGDRDI
jgi:hypothetical protein